MGCNRSGGVKSVEDTETTFQVKDRPIRFCVPRYGVARLQTLHILYTTICSKRF